MSNYLLKYADDASLLSPQNSPTPVELEMAHVMHWARENKMSLNLLKTVELCAMMRRRRFLRNVCVLYFQRPACNTFQIGYAF